ncbi:hypothetical protein NN561_015070 [Cricetulus griseus]
MRERTPTTVTVGRGLPLCGWGEGHLSDARIVESFPGRPPWDAAPCFPDPLSPQRAQVWKLSSNLWSGCMFAHPSGPHPGPRPSLSPSRLDSGLPACRWRGRSAEATALTWDSQPASFGAALRANVGPRQSAGRRRRDSKEGAGPEPTPGGPGCITVTSPPFRALLWRQQRSRY